MSFLSVFFGHCVPASPSSPVLPDSHRHRKTGVLLLGGVELGGSLSDDIWVYSHHSVTMWNPYQVPADYLQAPIIFHIVESRSTLWDSHVGLALPCSLQICIIPHVSGRVILSVASHCWRKWAIVSVSALHRRHMYSFLCPAVYDVASGHSCTSSLALMIAFFTSVMP